MKNQMRTNEDGCATLNGAVLIRQTAKAILVEFGGEEAWLPRSMIHETDLEVEGQVGFLDIPEWLADERGLHDE